MNTTLVSKGFVCALVMTSGCVADAAGTDTFFASGTEGASSSADSSGGDEPDQTSGSQDESGDTGQAETGGTGVGETSGTDGGPTFECEIEIGCHDGSTPAGVGVASVVPVGCGNGAFTLAQTINMSSYADPEAPRSIPFVGDFDGDGNLDLVINPRKATVGHVFAGDGTGQFTQPSAGTLAGGLFAGGWGGDLGDVDGDGVLDVLMGDHTRSARVWRGAGGFSFTEARAGLPDSPLYSGGGLGDIDGDGDLDAVFGADQFSSGVQVFLGDGAGAWTETTPMPITASNVGHFEFADYDADGDLDAFAFGKSGPGVTAFVLRNDGGSFSPAGQFSGGTGTLGADPLQGAVGDVNCDGYVDIAAGGTVYLGDGATWTLAATVDTSQISQLADMNGDGHLDLVTHDPAVGVGLYLGDGSGSGWVLDTEAGLPGPGDTSHGQAIDSTYGIEIADLDGNESLDIIRIAGNPVDYYVDVFVR